MLSIEDSTTLTPISLAEPAAARLHGNVEELRALRYGGQILTTLNGMAKDFGFTETRFEGIAVHGLSVPADVTCPDQRFIKYPDISFAGRFLSYEPVALVHNDPRHSLVGLCATFRSVRLLPERHRLPFRHILQVPIFGTVVREAADLPEVTVEDIEKLVVVDKEQPGDQDQ